MTSSFTTTCACPNCDGTGKLPHYSHIANGDCFACNGTGTISFSDFIGSNSDVALDVMLRNGRFWYATLRCRTWKNRMSPSHGATKEWGRDLWCKEINDADEARAIWRTAKQNGILTSCGE